MDDVRLCGKSESFDLCADCANQYSCSNCNGSSYRNFNPNLYPYPNGNSDRNSNQYPDVNSDLDSYINSEPDANLISNTTNQPIANVQKKQYPNFWKL